MSSKPALGPVASADRKESGSIYTATHTFRRGLEKRSSGDSERKTIPETKIAASNIDFYYGAFQALHDISLDFARNRITALIGPSGCGKSTFIRILNRMHET